MGRSEQAMIDFGKKIAAGLDAEPTAAERADVRARLLAADIPIAAPARSRRTLRWAGLLAAAALAAVVLLVARPAPPLAFTVGASATGEVGAWIAAPAAGEMPIRFSDGSALRLRAGGRGRVAAVEADGAEIALESGALELAIVHRDRTRWRVQAGPFVVHVVGTRFETSWDPVTQRFSLALYDGAVTVDGPILGVGRAVRTGERITVMADRGSLEVGEIDAPAGKAAPARKGVEGSRAAPEAEIPGFTGARERTSEAEVDAPSLDLSPGLSTSAPRAIEAPIPWRQLALDARYREALAAAESEGFSGLSGSLGAADLHLLADAARLGGSGARARQALVALHDRFPGSSDAGYAAFMLGRTAHQGGDAGAASTWLERYLREQPGGPFAEEASGRLLEIAAAGGDREAARRRAERYLATYPGGAHAEQARRVVDRGDR